MSEGTRQRSALQLALQLARVSARVPALVPVRVLARVPVPVSAAASASASSSALALALEAGGMASRVAGHGMPQWGRLAGAGSGAPPLASPRQLEAGGGSTRRQE